MIEQIVQTISQAWIREPSLLNLKFQRFSGHPRLLIGGDKASHLYVLNRENLGRLDIAGARIPQIFQPVSWGGLYNMALWTRTPSPIAYLVEQGDWTGAFQITDGRMEERPFSQTSVTSDWPNQGMSVSANGNAKGSGILWLTAGDHSLPDVPGVLYAFDALDLTNLLWSSEMKPRRDRMGRFAKFVTPTVANGRVYVPTLSNSLAIYGLLH